MYSLWPLKKSASLRLSFGLPLAVAHGKNLFIHRFRDQPTRAWLTILCLARMA
jgi:hypothetical protein